MKAANKTMMKGAATIKAITKLLGFEAFSVVLMWIVLMGAFLGFALARMQYYSKSALLANVGPGEAYWYSQPLYYAGMELHIAGALPAAVIMFFQFIPGIRKHAINVHRWMGRLWFVLMLAATVGAGIITRHAFGGVLSTQAASITTGIFLLGCMVQGYVNIRNKRIQEHREWMLRASAVAGSIFTLRLILLIANAIIDAINASGLELFYETVTCDEILAMSPQLYAEYKCPTVTGGVAVPASLSGNHATATSMLRITFGTAWWTALTLHGMLVEIWIIKRYRPLGKDLPKPATAPAAVEHQEAQVLP
jgi:uncharacterized membrane protein